MNLLVDLLSVFRSRERGEGLPTNEERRGMPAPGEPLGFFGRLTAGQERAVLDYRGDDMVGDPEDMRAIVAGSHRHPA